jgi:hypothetical protein
MAYFICLDEINIEIYEFVNLKLKKNLRNFNPLSQVVVNKLQLFLHYSLSSIFYI